MNGSSCPTCGWVLRWLPEQGAWGCDRCRKLVPASQVAPPPQQQPPQGSPYAPHGGPAPGPYSPHAMPPGQGYPMPPPGGPRSSRGLVLGLAAGAVAVAGAIVAVVLLTRGGDGGSGASSREDLVTRTLAAMGEGDVEKLVKLSDPVGLFNLALDCSERDKASKDKAEDKAEDKDAAEAEDKDKDKEPDKAAAEADEVDDDPQIEEKRVRRKHEKLVEKTKGLKIELISVSEKEKAPDPAKDGDGEGGAGKRRGTKKGDQAMKGCVLKVDVAFHELVAKVRVTEAEGKQPSEQEATLMAIHAGDSWFLMMPPAIRAGGGGIEAKLRGYRDQMCACKDAACADKIQEEMNDWAKTVRDEAEKLPRDEMKPLDDLDDEMKACRRKLREGDETLQMKEALAKMEGLKAKMCACADRACTERVQKELESWDVSKYDDDKVGGASQENMDRFAEITKGYIDCMTKVHEADPTALEQLPNKDSADDSSGSGGGGPGLASLPACAEYRRQLDRLRACPKYPPTAANAARQGYEQMEKAWARMRPTPATRDSMNETCQTIATSLKDALATLCP